MSDKVLQFTYFENIYRTIILDVIISWYFVNTFYEMSMDDIVLYFDTNIRRIVINLILVILSFIIGFFKFYRAICY